MMAALLSDLSGPYSSSGTTPLWDMVAQLTRSSNEAPISGGRDHKVFWVKVMAFHPQTLDYSSET